MTDLVGVIDTDWCLADTFVTYLKEHNKKYETSFTKEDITQWDYWHDLNVTREEAFDLLFQTMMRTDIPVVPGAYEALKIIKDAGVKLINVTNRPKEATKGTLEWTTANYPYLFEDIVINNRKDKGALIKSLNADFSFDDHIDNLEDCKLHGVPEGILYRVNHNKHVCSPNGFYQTHNWSFVPGIVQSIAQKLQK